MWRVKLQLKKIVKNSQWYIFFFTSICGYPATLRMPGETTARRVVCGRLLWNIEGISFVRILTKFWQTPFAVAYSRRSDCGVKREVRERGNYEEKRERESFFKTTLSSACAVPTIWKPETGYPQTHVLEKHQRGLSNLVPRSPTTKKQSEIWVRD